MLKALSFSSLFIGLCAFSLSLFYGHLLDSIILPRAVIVGLATVAAYNFVQLLPFKVRGPISDRSRWMKNNSKLLWSLSLTCLALCLALSYYLSLYDWINYLHLFTLCLLYEDSFGNRPARKIPYLKPFYISYIWTMACAAPVIYDTQSWEGLILLVECFLFMLSLCILFDLRDTEEDKSLGLSTLSNSFSLRQIKTLSISLMALSLGILLATVYADPIQLGAYFFAYSLITWKISKNSSERYFLCLLDGMILFKLFLL